MIDVYKKIQALFVMAPVWETGVWETIKNQDYRELEIRLRNFLKNELSPGQWGEVYWAGILKGIPSFRDGTDEKVWQEYALPAIGRAIIGATSGNALIAAYSSLEEYIKQFHQLIINSIPGATYDKKWGWLKTNKPSVFSFYTTNIAGLGIDPKRMGPLTEERYEKFKDLPRSLKEALFSNKTSEIIARIAQKNHISQEKLSHLSDITGLVILGQVHKEDLIEEIQKRIYVDRRIAQTIGDEIQSKILEPLLSYKDEVLAAETDKQDVNIESSDNITPNTQSRADTQKQGQGKSQYESLSPVFRKETNTSKTNNKAEQEEQFNDPPQTTSPQKQAPSQNLTSPFILHEEEPATEQVKKPFLSNELERPYFFEQNSADKEGVVEPIRARIELGGAQDTQKKTLKSSKTQQESVRVVNYSGPSTQINPFKGNVKEQNNPVAKSTPVSEGPKSAGKKEGSVHPDNIVDLKDLPK